MVGNQDEIRIGGLFELALILILGVSCLLFFLYVIPYHLLYEEQMQLFLFSSDYFLSYFSKPGWLACYIGDFLTQFYYIKGGGAIVISGVLGVVLLMLFLVFSRVGKRDSWLYIVLPVLALWFLHTETNYRLSSTIAFFLALFFFLLYSLIQKQHKAGITGLLLSIFLYSFIGSHFLTFIFLVVIFDLSKRRYSSFPYWLFLVVIGICCPLFCREYYLLTVRQAFLYPMNTLYGFLPSLFLVGLFMIYILSSDNKSFRYQQKESGILLLFTVAFMAGIFLNINQTREKLLSLDIETYSENWEKVSRKAESYQMKNPVATYFTNIAWMKQGILPDKLLSCYQPFSEGMFIPVGPHSNPLEITFSGEIYYQLGDMNMAQHSTMLAMTFSPQSRSARLIKRLAEINLVIGDTAAVNKYLRILDKTLFYTSYASNMRTIMEEGEQNPWLMQKRSLIATYDTLRTAADATASLTMLIESNPSNKAALDYLLCYHLLNKNIPSFMEAFDKWYKEKEYPLPKFYSEALLIGLAQKKVSAKTLESYHIPNELTATFMTYTKRYQEAEGNGVGLQKDYGDTYWFYYHYAQKKK
ncbi:DUF6057 family protein [Massilibacteroides sp.]|uniref:DUF6057 family protein n=1 Tax=Massilibacteroides sp. TaxID=2034766 RepID=UPI0026326EC8|nr:DUF6057 family protein [Massilibacteroides sp.]MDD4514126.1 DUF6057 family protein [Massilibacteroides sp.]